MTMCQPTLERHLESTSVVILDPTSACYWSPRGSCYDLYLLDFDGSEHLRAKTDERKIL